LGENWGGNCGKIAGRMKCHRTRDFTFGPRVFTKDCEGDGEAVGRASRLGSLSGSVDGCPGGPRCGLPFHSAPIEAAGPPRGLGIILPNRVFPISVDIIT